MFLKSTFVHGVPTPGAEERSSGGGTPSPEVLILSGCVRCRVGARPSSWGGSSMAPPGAEGGGQEGPQDDKPTGTAEQESQLLKMIILCMCCFYVTFNYQLLRLMT